MNFILTTVLFALLANNIIADDCLPCNQIHFQQQICIVEIVFEGEVVAISTGNNVTLLVLIVKQSIKGSVLVVEQAVHVIPSNADCMTIIVGGRYIITATLNSQRDNFGSCTYMFDMPADVLESYGGGGKKRICTCSPLADIPENANSTDACFFPVGEANCYSSWAQCKRSHCRAPCEWHFPNANHTSCEPISHG